MGGAFIGGAVVGDVNEPGGAALLGVGILLAAVGSVFAMIGVITKGVQVGTRD